MIYILKDDTTSLNTIKNIIDNGLIFLDNSSLG